MDKKELRNIIISGAMDAGALLVFHWLTGKAPEPGTKVSKEDMIHALAHRIIVGPKKGKGDEAIYAGLKAKLKEKERDNLDEFFEDPRMTKQRRDEFRFCIALIAEKLNEETALAALRKIAEKETVDEMFSQADKDGLIDPDKPESLEALKARITVFWDKLKATLELSGITLEDLTKDYLKNFGEDIENSGLLEWSESFRDNWKNKVAAQCKARAEEKARATAETGGVK